MELSSFLIMLVAYAGIAAGFFVGKIAPEERRPLKAAVHVLQHIGAFLSFGAAWMGAYFNQDTVLMAVFVALAAFVIYAHTTSIRPINRHRLTLSSIVLGVFLVCTSGIMTLFIASGIFIFFSSVAILGTTSKMSSFGRLAVQTCWFFTAIPLTAL